MIRAVRVGIADHFGWAVAVAASGDGRVADRRRIELVDPGLSGAPIHYDRGRRSDDEAAGLVARVRASAARRAATALDALAAGLPAPVVGLCLRDWPADFPEDVATLRGPAYEARADAVMYRRVLAEVAAARGWVVHRYDAKRVIGQAELILGPRAEEVLRGPRARLGPPWTRDHRMALAATIVAGAERPAG
jgi:hypothetical protein